MKIILSILIGLISLFNPSSLVYGSIQDTAKQKNVFVGDTARIAGNSVSDYSISVNGQSNSVQITQNTSAEESAGIAVKQTNASNTIEINGEGNSVKIDQGENGGGVNIQQSGHGNRVSITQTNSYTGK